MKNILTSFSTAFIFLTSSKSLAAEVKLLAIFGDNSVLQQNTETPFWGKGKPNSTVKITTSWNGKSYLTSYGKGLNCFEVRRANKRLFPAEEFITDTSMKMFSPRNMHLRTLLLETCSMPKDVRPSSIRRMTGKLNKKVKANLY